MTAFTSRATPLEHVSQDDIGRWRELADVAIEPNVFLDPRFLLTSARHFATARDLQLLIVNDGDRIVGLMAIAEVVSPSLRRKVLSTGGPFLGTHAAVSHPLVAPDDPVGIVREIFLALRRFSRHGVIDLNQLAAEGELAEAIETALSELRLPSAEIWREPRAFYRRAEPISVEASACLDKESIVPDFTARHLKPKRRSYILRQSRALERMTHEPLRLTTSGSGPEGVERFLALQVAGWKGDPARGDIAFRLNSDKEHWFTDVVDEFERDSRLVVHELTVADRTVYAEVSLVSGEALFGYADAYDEEFSRFGLGTLGRVAILNRVESCTALQSFDPCVHTSYTMASRLYPQQRMHHGLLIGYGGPASRALVRGYTLARRARAWLRDAGKSSEHVDVEAQD